MVGAPPAAAHGGGGSAEAASGSVGKSWQTEPTTASQSEALWPGQCHWTGSASRRDLLLLSPPTSWLPTRLSLADPTRLLAGRGGGNVASCTKGPASENRTEHRSGSVS